MNFLSRLWEPYKRKIFSPPSFLSSLPFSHHQLTPASTETIRASPVAFRCEQQSLPPPYSHSRLVFYFISLRFGFKVKIPFAFRFPFVLSLPRTALYRIGLVSERHSGQGHQFYSHTC